MFFGWITTRTQLLSAGYGWLIRAVFGGIALIGFMVSFFQEVHLVRELSAIVLVVLVIIGILFSIPKVAAKINSVKKLGELAAHLDLLAALAGVVGVIAAAVVSGGVVWIQIFRFLIGAFFIGALTDTMLLGHWYLVQPGLTRNPLKHLVRWAGLFCVLELLVWVLPFGKMSTAMFSVLNGSVDDGQGGLLGWFWVTSTIATLILVFISDRALKEKGYQAVMATTGLAYLSLLTGFIEDVMARLALSGF